MSSSPVGQTVDLARQEDLPVPFRNVVACGGGKDELPDGHNATA